MMQTKSVPVTKQMIWSAYKKVRANRGSAGVDGISLEEYEKKLDKHLYKIWNRMASGSYFPPPVREVEIPKSDGGKRQLGIPTISDRVAQTVVKDYLEPRMEKQFHPHSYGYRPEKSAHQAVEQVKRNCWRQSWVIDLDIKGFFDNIDHKLLMKLVERNVTEKWVLMYVQRWLEMPIQKVNKEIQTKQGKGTPQGGVISPLLANLFLHYAFDKWIQNQFPKISFVRYADDIIVHCNTREEAERMLRTIRERMEKCALEVHPEKTKIVYCKKQGRKLKYPTIKFDFLGFTFQPRKMKVKGESKLFLSFLPAISNKSKKRIVAEIRKLRIQRWTEATIEEIAEWLNPKITGWVNYYGKQRRRAMQIIFKALHSRLYKWARNRYKNLRSNKANTWKFLGDIYKTNRELFYHWKVNLCRI